MMCCGTRSCSSSGCVCRHRGAAVAMMTSTVFEGPRITEKVPWSPKGESGGFPRRFGDQARFALRREAVRGEGDGVRTLKRSARVQAIWRRSASLGLEEGIRDAGRRQSIDLLGRCKAPPWALRITIDVGRRRFQTGYDFEEITKAEPERSLLGARCVSAARNDLGRMTCPAVARPNGLSVIIPSRKKTASRTVARSRRSEPHRRIAARELCGGEKSATSGPQTWRGKPRRGVRVDILPGSALPRSSLSARSAPVELKPGRAKLCESARARSFVGRREVRAPPTAVGSFARAQRVPCDRGPRNARTRTSLARLAVNRWKGISSRSWFAMNRRHPHGARGRRRKSPAVPWPAAQVTTRATRVDIVSVARARSGRGSALPNR